MPEQEKKEGKEGKRGREGRERKRKEMHYKMWYLSSSVNKLTCVHTDEPGWLDNEDSSIELLGRFPMQQGSQGSLVNGLLQEGCMIKYFPQPETTQSCLTNPTYIL